MQERRGGPKHGMPEGEPAPSPDDGEWREWGGELILVMGETSGGAPFGTSLAEYRWNNEQWARKAGWAQAKRALRAAFEVSLPTRTEIDIDFVEALGGGLTRDAFGTHVYLRPDPEGQSGVYVALVPNDKALSYAKLARRELDVLRWLAAHAIDLRVPRAIALVDDHGSPILIESFVEGVAVDLRAGRQPIRPWEIVAEVAAMIHSVPPPPTLPPRTRRAHRLELIESLEHFGQQLALVDEALAWMRDHVGESAPGVLLHGDLLGQNLRIHPSDATGVIDWHHVEVGDPAADLAIVTRGVRRPFQLAGGRKKLLDAYNERSATEVSAESLRFFELALVTRWVIEANEGQHLDAWLRQIERMLGSHSA
ncbi:MAG: phosphotransferase [Myxococcota bacterium]